MMMLTHCVCCMQDEQKELDEILAKRSKASRSTEDKPMEEKTTLHSMFHSCLRASFPHSFQPPSLSTSFLPFILPSLPSLFPLLIPSFPLSFFPIFLPFHLPSFSFSLFCSHPFLLPYFFPSFSPTVFPIFLPSIPPSLHFSAYMIIFMCPFPLPAVLTLLPVFVSFL